MCSVNNVKEKGLLWWIIFILLCIWQLPQLLVAVIMLPFMGKLKLVADRHFNFGFEGEGMSGGISLGPISYVSQYLSKSEEAIAHEVDGHTVQSKILGPLYLLIIGLPSVLHAWLYDYHKTCYYDFWTESNANKWAGLIVDGCHLKFRNEK